MSLIAVLVLGFHPASLGAQTNLEDVERTAVVQLVVESDNRLATSEQLLQARLQQLGHEVLIVEADEVTLESIRLADLGIISGTVPSADLDPEVLGVERPLMVLSRWLYPDAGFVSSLSDVKPAFLSKGDVVADGHPLAAGLSGRVQLVTSAATTNAATTGGEVTDIIDTTATSETSLLFSYEPGATLTDGTPAPALRIGAPFTRSSIPLLTDAGWELFDAAVASALPDDEDDDVEVLYEDDRLLVTYRRLASAAQSVTSEIRIENRSSVAITDWTLLFESEEQITSVARANLVSQERRDVEIVGGPSIADIRPGQAVSFDFVVETDDPSRDPVPQWVVLLENGIGPDDDVDGDGVPDYIEIAAGMNPNSVDSDDDGLEDGVEWAIRVSSPIDPDTDDDGTTDDLEDLDEDGLTNRDEVAAGTELLSFDTDQDALGDGDELQRGTDPRVADTDGDGVEDGREVQLGTDPLAVDTEFDVTRSVDGEMTSPQVTVNDLSAEQVNSLAIVPLSEDDPTLGSDTPGFVDRGYEFLVNGDFDQAEISFAFDPSLVGPDFQPAIYTYDDDSQLLVEVDGQVVDGNTVSVMVDHFSNYILLNKIEFDRVWLFEFLEVPDGDPFERYDVVLSIDSSGSMTSNDPSGERIAVAQGFVNQLSGDSRAAVVDFDTTGTVLSQLTTDKASLSAALGQIDSSGGTSISAGVSTALDVLDAAPPGDLGPAFEAVVLLTDGAGSYSPALTQRAADSGVVIYTVGLGSAVDVGLLTGIAEGTGGEYFPAAQADELDAIFAAISDRVDLFRDSDSDGIVDYYEREMRAGRLRVGTGAPLTLMDPFNPDSDGDGLLDGQELTVLRVGPGDAPVARVYGLLTSDPQAVDSDLDGIDDPSDPLPLVFNAVDMLIHQSAHREGRRKEPDLNNFQVPPSTKIADDLTYNDYTFGELRQLGWLFNVGPITPEFLLWRAMNDAFDVGRFGASSDHQVVANDLRDLFRNGNGGNSSPEVSVDDDFDPAAFRVYSSPELDRAAGGSSQYQEYIDTALRIVVDSIEANDGSLDHLQVQDDLNQNYLYQEFEVLSIYPVWDFSVRDANERALSIAIHAFHGHQIRIRDYQLTDSGFSGTLVFRSYDHFGLDPDDEIGNHGFADWFALQHWDRFDGRYQPPIAAVEVERSFSGSL